MQQTLLSRKTEAKLLCDIVETEDGHPFTFRLVGGRYWWSFGIHNDEWFSTINRFYLISPAAAEVVPAHYNEVGIMAEGEIKLADSFGANYAVSVGNGMPSFELMNNVVLPVLVWKPCAKRSNVSGVSCLVMGVSRRPSYRLSPRFTLKCLRRKRNVPIACFIPTLIL